MGHQMTNILFFSAVWKRLPFNTGETSHLKEWLYIYFNRFLRQLSKWKRSGPHQPAVKTSLYFATENRTNYVRGKAIGRISPLSNLSSYGTYVLPNLLTLPNYEHTPPLQQHTPLENSSRSKGVCVPNRRNKFGFRISLNSPLVNKTCLPRIKHLCPYMKQHSRHPIKGLFRGTGLPAPNLALNEWEMLGNPTATMQEEQECLKFFQRSFQIRFYIAVKIPDALSPFQVVLCC